MIWMWDRALKHAKANRRWKRKDKLLKLLSRIIPWYNYDNGFYPKDEK